jgi:hypothetical protein
MEFIFLKKKDIKKISNEYIDFVNKNYDYLHLCTFKTPILFYSLKNNKIK